MGWKNVAFGGSDSAERVRRLQAFCAASPDDASHSDAAFDALLIIGGVDSFHSQVSQAVLKYLFLGSSGQELLGEQVISQANDRLEDVVLLLTRHRVSVFYSSESDAAVQLLPMLAQWHNVTEYTIHDAMDPDEQEQRKIEAFKQMVGGATRIGIPYGVDAGGRDLQDAMVPETWPLVQAFGLENGAHGSGFFTMSHAVVNVTSLLKEEMARLDDFSAKRVALEVAPLLAHHFNQFLLKLDHAESPAARNAKSEAEMGEDLLSFFEFGTTQHEARGLAVAAHRGSRVLFGTRTAEAAAARSSADEFLHTAGDANGPATHMRVQSEDPFSGVRFTRTYFLATGKTAPRVVDEDALVHREEAAELSAKHSEDKDRSVDTRVMIELYALLLRGFRAAVRALTQHASTATLAQSLAAAKAAALRDIQDAAAALAGSRSTALAESSLSASFFEERLAISAESLDACGGETHSAAQKWRLVYLSLEFTAVPSQLHAAAGTPLGALAVGDTLLFETKTSGDAALPFVNTTASFAYFRSWIQPGREFDSVKALLAVLQSGFMLQSPALRLGQPMAPLDAALDDSGRTSAISEADAATSIAPSHAPPPVGSVGLSRAVLLLECDELPQLHGTLQLFSGGFCFTTPHVVPIVVSFAQHVASFGIAATAFEELVLLQLELKADGAQHGQTTPVSRALPLPLASRTVAFPLLAGTRFQEEIVHALRVWKGTAEALDVPFYRPHALAQFDGLTPRDEKPSPHGDHRLSPVMARTCASLVRKTAGSDATTAAVDALFPRWFIPRDAAASTALPKPRKSDRGKTVVPLTVVLGLPGSSAASTAATVCAVSSSSYDWERVDVDCREAPQALSHDAYASEQIQTRTAAALQRILANSAGERPPRVMLCVVGYVGALAVAAAIKTHAAARGGCWPLATKIASVVGCVSATNVYLPDAGGAQSPLPRLFDQLASGFATHVVVTHSGDVAAPALGRLRFRVDQTNPFADIHVLPSDVFEGSLTPLLSVDRLESVYYAAYRQAHSPDWANRAVASTEEDPARRPESVRFEVAPGIEKTRFLQSVGRTLTPHAAMTKSMDKIHPLDVQAMMARPQADVPAAKGGIRLAQTLAAEKVLAQERQQRLLRDAQDAYGECWSVEAVVSFAGDAGTVYEYVSTGAYARMRVVNGTAAAGGGMEIKITGRGLHAAKLQELVLGCYVKMDGAVQPLKTKVALTLQEKRDIQKQHTMDELPEGFYYDGITYVDQFGGRHEFHPRMAEFLDEHVRALNEKTEQHNAAVEQNRRAQRAFVRQLV